VVMNGSFMTRSPTEHQHFNSIVATYAMAPVVSFLESDVGLYIVSSDANTCEPGVQIL